ncbi:MAG: Do family serine endopeptidase [Bacteroidales bacterium]|nr:Do family serine endopeptidase [Bacteroidales bacterium]MBQ9172241.1 Do family serine endopeptidase [Bacteroidales bacterium]MBQ9712022.1 Do family serine endopeptidase [Bacteroidales bacterium]
MSKGIMKMASVILGSFAAFGALMACTTGQAGTQTVSQDGSVYRTVNLTETDYPDLTYAAESCVDAVVLVKVTVRSQQNYDIDPFLRYFFGFGDSQPREQQGSGSGVIIRPDGYIVTNNHVVANASKVEVTLNNNRTFEATVVGTDPATDVALIKIEAEGLPTVEFGDSDALRLGEWVLAIGSPMGEQLRGTITAGIVSAKGRSMPTEGEFKIESFIQTDAAVNPGNSGGALVNKKGELVGINTAIMSQNGSYVGYSFAVPVNIVKKIVGDIIDFGSVKRAKLGVSMSNVTDEIAKELKLSSTKGVYIHETLKGSAAEKAGIRKGDIITNIDGTEIATASALQEKVNSYHPGDKATFTILREGNVKTVEVELQGDAEATGTVDTDGSIAFYGSKIKTAPKEKLEALGLKSGVEVVSVGEGKMLSAGASEGFIILYVNDQAVSKAEEVVEIAKKSRRAVYIEGVTASGRSSYFAFGKEE